MAQSIANPGYDPIFRPAFILHNMAEGGAAGGLVSGFLGARAYAMGYSTIMALPIFQDTLLAMLAGIVTAIIVAALVSVVIGYNEADR